MCGGVLLELTEQFIASSVHLTDLWEVIVKISINDLWEVDLVY